MDTVGPGAAQPEPKKTPSPSVLRNPHNISGTTDAVWVSVDAFVFLLLCVNHGSIRDALGVTHLADLRVSLIRQALIIPKNKYRRQTIDWHESS
jgi:hypothetical protein